MVGTTRQVVAIVGSLAVGGMWVWNTARRAESQVIDAGVWFEPGSFHSAATGALSADDLARIERVARTEIRLAFEGLRFALSDSRTAAYRVRVAPAVYNPAFRARLEVAGASSAIAGLGGHGAVSFRFLASGAVARAAPGAAREAVIEGIGRGIGRTVVHELVHQLLPTTPYDKSDVGSYEYESADRVEQYYGPMRWDGARALLERRFGDPPR